MTAFRFDGQVALITGPAADRPRSRAGTARRGTTVIVNDPGGAVDGTAGDGDDPAPAVADEIPAAGDAAVANYDSVATPDGGAAMVAQARRVRPAGHRRQQRGHPAGQELRQPQPRAGRPGVDVHLRGAFHILIPAWQQMKLRSYGRIVTTISGTGLFGHFGQANYGAANAGLVGLTQCWRWRAARTGSLSTRSPLPPPPG